MSIIISNSFATELSIENLNLDLVNGVGSIRSDKMTIKNDFISFNLGPNDLAIKQNKGNLTISHHNSSADITLMQVENRVAVLKDLKKLIVDGVNISLKDSLSLSTNNLTLMLKEDNLIFDNIKFNCPVVSAPVINSCLNDSYLTIAQLQLPESMAKNLAAKLEELDQTQVSQLNSELIKLHDFTIGFNSNHFEGSAAIKLLFKIKVEFSGDLDIDLKNRTISITSLEIKKGMIPMTELLLQAVKQARSAGIEVDIKKKAIYYHF